ncbi:hypothetical protein E2542_SST11268 [Spatholobus suberectus]|nr:hypothetical protein E2542_SST11268 [Spatholobus suberectus]
MALAAPTKMRKGEGKMVMRKMHICTATATRVIVTVPRRRKGDFAIDITDEEVCIFLYLMVVVVVVVGCNGGGGGGCGNNGGGGSDSSGRESMKGEAGSGGSSGGSNGGSSSGNNNSDDGSGRSGDHYFSRKLCV